MANFFKRVFSRVKAPENERVPAGGQTPRTADTLIGASGAPDPDFHPEAAADASADAEAGAVPREAGRIEPLKRRE